MSGWGESRYSGLGFDPLPGDPEVARSLASDAAILGSRLHDQAGFLRNAAKPEQWSGEAAEAFTAQLGELPAEMDRMGDAFDQLAAQLRIYHDRFETAKSQVETLNQRALEARARAQTLLDAEQGPSAPRIDPRPAFTNPVAPGMWPGDPAPASADLVAATNALETILDQARRLDDDFDLAQSDLEVRIRDLTQWAPKPPHHGWLDRLVHGVEHATGIDRLEGALHRVNELFSDCALYLSNLSDVLQSVSAVLGAGSLLLFWVPGVGASLGALSMATAAGAATIKTGLYLTGAKDKYGRPYVSGKELAGSLITVAVGAASAGIGAAAERAGSMAEAATALKNAETAEEVAAAKAAQKAVPSVFKTAMEDVNAEKLKEGLDGLKETVKSEREVLDKVGGKAFLKHAAKEVRQNLAEISGKEMGLTAGARAFDLANPVVAPLATEGRVDVKDVGGFQSAFTSVKELPGEFKRYVEHGEEPVDLHFRSPREGPRITSPGEPMKPVMR